MRKLIEIQQGHLIECDNKNCAHVIRNANKAPNGSIKQYINMPCPECGCNLLTNKDYLDSTRFIRILNWINKWFSWITIFIPRKHKKESSAKVHNGIMITHYNSKDCELREALTVLRDLADIQNGAPLVQHEQEWEEIMERTYDLLAKYES